MKKILLAFTAALFGLALYAGQIDTSATVIAREINLQDYCPQGYICVATNMKAKGYEGASPLEITGISVYKSNGNYIAYVPGHGHLSLTWQNSGWIGWAFFADNSMYVIQNLGKDA